MDRKKTFLEFMPSLYGEGVPGFVAWLDEQGFFTLPASINHHGAEEGGLFNHSLTVAEELVKLTHDNALEWERPESPYIVGMFHDLCKLDAYEQEIDEPGHEVFGGGIVGRTYTFGYRSPEDQLYTGHGDKSVLMLAPWVNLTAEEVACIRWHMGAFDEKENWRHYTAAIHDFPNVLWTHHADMIAAHIKGI